MKLIFIFFFFCFLFSLNEEQIAAAKRLLLTIDVINETVGDAISDMFLVEVILQANGWDVKDWYEMYVDLPNLQKKISVVDRNVITTADAERICVTPAGLQDEIDKAVAKYPRGRSFVRPSGTEDVVRVYTEAARKEVCSIVPFHSSSSHDDTTTFHFIILFFSFRFGHRTWIVCLPKYRCWCENLPVALDQNHSYRTTTIMPSK